MLDSRRAGGTFTRRACKTFSRVLHIRINARRHTVLFRTKRITQLLLLRPNFRSRLASGVVHTRARACKIRIYVTAHPLHIRGKLLNGACVPPRRLVHSAASRLETRQTYRASARLCIRTRLQLCGINFATTRQAVLKCGFYVLLLAVRGCVYRHVGV